MFFPELTVNVITIEYHLGLITMLLAIFLTNPNDTEEREPLQIFK